MSEISGIGKPPDFNIHKKPAQETDKTSAVQRIIKESAAIVHGGKPHYMVGKKVVQLQQEIRNLHSIILSQPAQKTQKAQLEQAFLALQTYEQNQLNNIKFKDLTTVGANGILKNADPGQWLLRYSVSQNSLVQSMKLPDGNIGERLVKFPDDTPSLFADIENSLSGAEVPDETLEKVHEYLIKNPEDKSITGHLKLGYDIPRVEKNIGTEPVTYSIKIGCETDLAGYQIVETITLDSAAMNKLAERAISTSSPLAPAEAVGHEFRSPEEYVYSEVETLREKLNKRMITPQAALYRLTELTQVCIQRNASKEVQDYLFKVLREVSEL
jgi:hypothetical protein